MGYERVQKKNSSRTPSVNNESHQKLSKINSFEIQPQANNDTSAPKITSKYSSYAADLILAKMTRGLNANQQNQLESETKSGEASSERNPIQTKLTIGEAGDKYEQEADAMAEKVMSMDIPSSSQQPSVQRQIISPAAKTEIQAKLTKKEQTTGITPNLESNLGKGGGTALDEQTRSFMEPRFGSDFSAVRVHTDTTAIQMNRELGAQAFTHGNNIYFGAGKSPGKNNLTAHELTHTIQQTGGIQLRPQVKPDKIIKNKLSTGIQPRIQRKTDPGQILEQIKNTPPSQAATTYQQAQTTSTSAWSEQKQELEQTIPKIPAPTGIPGQNTSIQPTSEIAGKAGTNKEALLAGGKKAGVAPKVGKASEMGVVNAPPHSITPTHIAGGNTTTTGEKDNSQVAASAKNALNSINLNSSQINTKVGNAPKVNLTDGATNPAQLDTEQQQANQQVQQEKTKAAQGIHKDYGENKIAPKPSNEILKTNKKLTLAQVPGAKGGKESTVPPEIAGNLDQSLGPKLQERIGGEQSKYTIGKNKFDQDTVRARTDADQKIDKLNKETSQKQLESQKRAQTEVASAKLEWQTELDAVEQDYQKKAGKATTEQKSKIDAEKQKGDAAAAQHLADAEKEAEKQKQTAETEAQKKKDAGEKESGGFFGWLADKASAFVDGIKQAVNFIYDKLREGIKFIFEQAKKLALAAIELAQKAITTLIQAYGEILKGIVNVVFAAFPDIAKKINNKIDQAVKVAVQVVNTAADLLKKGVSAVLDFLANTLNSLLKLIQDIYNGIFTVIGMIIRGEFGELIQKLGNLVAAAKAAPPQFETAGLEELLGGNLDEPLSPGELAQAGIAPPGVNGNTTGGGQTNSELPQAPWTPDNVGVDAVEKNMELSPELMAQLMHQTKGGGEVNLAESNDASRTMEAIMSEAGGKEGESKEGATPEAKNPDDGLSPKQRAQVRWNLMKTGISQWWSNNWPTVLLGATAAIGGFIALNVVSGGAITAALPAIMAVVGPLFTGVTIAQIGGHIRDYLAKGWAGDIPGGGKSLAKGLAAGAVELISYLTFKAGDVALKGAKAAVKGAKTAVQGGMKLAQGAVNLIAKGAKFIIEKGKVLFKGIAGTALGKGFKRLKDFGAALLERMRFKKFKIKLEGMKFQLWGEINPWVLLADGNIQEVSFQGQGRKKIGDVVKHKGEDAIVIGIRNQESAIVKELRQELPELRNSTYNAFGQKGLKSLVTKRKKLPTNNEDWIKWASENPDKVKGLNVQGLVEEYAKEHPEAVNRFLSAWFSGKYTRNLSNAGHIGDLNSLGIPKDVLQKIASDSELKELALMLRPSNPAHATGVRQITLPKPGTATIEVPSGASMRVKDIAKNTGSTPNDVTGFFEVNIYVNGKAEIFAFVEDNNGLIKLLPRKQAKGMKPVNSDRLKNSTDIIPLPEGNITTKISSLATPPVSTSLGDAERGLVGSSLYQKGQEVKYLAVSPDQGKTYYLEEAKNLLDKRGNLRTDLNVMVVGSDIDLLAILSRNGELNQISQITELANKHPEMFNALLETFSTNRRNINPLTKEGNIFKFPSAASDIQHGAQIPFLEDSLLVKVAEASTIDINLLKKKTRQEIQEYINIYRKKVGEKIFKEEVENILGIKDGRTILTIHGKNYTIPLRDVPMLYKLLGHEFPVAAYLPF